MQLRRREQKNIHLGVHVLRTQVAWLSAPVRWEEGRLTWDGVVLDPGLLWKTQKRLRELCALGKPMAVEQQMLEQVKRLHKLTETDTIGMLVAEALCENALPFSPSQMLARRGREALPELIALAADPLTPQQAQPLIALVTAVCEGKRALPSNPDLMARLLALDPAFPTGLLGELPVLQLTAESLRQKVREGLPVVEVVSWLAGAQAQKALLCLPELQVHLAPLPLPSALVACTLAERLLLREVPQPVGPEAPSLVRYAPQMLEALGPVLERETTPEWLDLVARCADVFWPHPELTIKARLKGKNREEAILRKAQHWRSERQLRVQELYALFARCQDAALAEEVLRSGRLWALRFDAPDRALYRLVWSLLLEFQTSELTELVSRYSSVAEFRSDFGEILRAIRSLPEATRGTFFQAVVWAFENRPREERQQLSALAPRLRTLLPLFPAPEGEFPPYWWVGGLLMVLKYLSDERLAVAVATLRRLRTFDSDRLLLTVRLTSGIEDGAVLFGELLERLLTVELDWVPLRAAVEFSQHQARFPQLFPLLAELAREQPRRAVEQMAQLGGALRLGLAALEPLHALFSPTAERSEAWEAVTAYLPDCPDLAWVAREPLPPGMARLLALPERLQREADYLAGHPELAVRLAALQARLADSERLTKTIAEELSEAVAHLARQRRREALIHAVEEVYRNRLRTIIGSRALSVTMTPDVMNAALLTLDISQNRRLLIRLLRAYFDGDTHWALVQKPNMAYLEALTERGIDAIAWRGAHPETRSGLHFHLETDPLHILQMGNYFDTCLSFGGCNAFSTVANACDANKRVLYVRDSKGRVVARQLLAIGSEGTLLGFHVYSTLALEERPRLTAAVLDYVTCFAQLCGLTLGAMGSVPTLLAEDWYDDGISDWEALVVHAPPTSSATSSRSPHGQRPRTPALPAP